jgi:SAM-dependent methyltransferase
MSGCSVQHGTEAPSAWVQRWTHLLSPGGTVLDVACGHGRHMHWFASQGHLVTGIDRSPEAIAAVASLGTAIQADIENAPWPLLKDGQPRTFDAVVVTNYLWRPLFPTQLASLAPGGVLIYETFTAGNETVGKPSRPDFLLQSGELLRVCAGLRIVAYEDGYQAAPERFVQRIVAVRAAHLSTDDAPARYPL